ncbi:MAG: thioesterase family protein [Bacteroidales bacterium]|nr:thioesterase family protein [Bacteroidales bacterium]
MFPELRLNTGLRSEQKRTTTVNDSAAKCGSGLLEVFATPALVALMEQTALSAIEHLLPQGCTTVGTLINVKHVKATPIGMEVRCESVLTEVDGRRLVFEVKAYDEKGLIGEAVHERFVVESERFLAKTYAS